jgi:hypothetical protein
MGNTFETSKQSTLTDKTKPNIEEAKSMNASQI